MLKRIALIGALLIGTSVVAQGDDTHRQYELNNAHDLYDLCHGAPDGGTMCQIFMVGYLSGYLVTWKAYVVDHNIKEAGPFCPHVGVDTKLMIDVFVSYIDNHPEKAKESWTAALTDALTDHWPCK